MSKENSLFKEATIKRLVSDVKLTAKHKKAVNKWLEYLKNQKLENEKQAYIEFANIILKDLLDYDISLEGLKHEEENIEFLFKKEGNNLICFEAKGAKTKDLWAYQGRSQKSRETPVNQINSYLYDKIIPFGILTNYKLFVLFDRNEGSKKYHLIDFTELTNEDKLKEFIALFSREQVEKGFITEVIQQSIVEEREFTKEFYKLYHETRLMLIKEFEENSEISREASVHFAQLYLNRLMFVFFAEDTGKIDKRIIEDRIIKTLDNIHLFSSNSSNISNVLVGLFNDLDKGSDFPVKLFGFNGGLFKHPIPPKIFFRDFRDDKFFKDVNQNSKLKKKELELNENEKEVFHKYKYKISPVIKNILIMNSFDFNSEVNVNILGHIFEQSISDIEDLKTNKSSRRKKEGIFYTPEYITDYICRNTIIPYLSKKGINSIPELIKEYAENIEELEEKFKSIKILDPACGSGAFLIKATEIMLEIFKAIQEFKQSEGEYEAKKGLKKKSNTKGQLVLEKWNEETEAREIIESSIHGVDINEESVEITKLSLFLKMARKNRKLTDLSNNIKQGNSLIDDKEIAGELAFDWGKEFKTIMDKGGFDVVIGNPPYVNANDLKKNISDKEYAYLKNNYVTAKGTVDLYIYFFEKGLNILNTKGVLSFITPNRFLSASYGTALRKYLIENCQIVSLIDYSDKSVFPDASTYPVISFIKSYNVSNYKILTGKFDENTKKLITKKISSNKLTIIDDYILGFLLNDKLPLVEKIINKSISLKNVGKINATSTASEAEEYSKIINTTNGYKLINTGVIDPYVTTWGYDFLTDKGTKYKTPYLPKENNTISKNRHELYSSPKIIISKIGLKCEAFYDMKGEYSSINTNCIHSFNEDFIPEYILCWLNSKLYNYMFECFFDGLRMSGGYLLYSAPNLKNTYIKNISINEQKPFIEKADLMLNLNNEFYEKKNKFFNRIKKSFGLETLNKKVNSFYTLEFNDFIKEIEKLGKKKLSLKEQDEWEDYFNEYKKDLSNLKDEIEKTDNKINKRVYKLYGLSKDEIKIIEKSMK